MKNKVKTPESEAQGKGCGMGCVSYIILAIIFGWITGNEGDWWIGVALVIAAIIGYGVYKNELPKLEKQAVEKKKASEDAAKKEKKRVEDKLDKIKSDAGVEEKEEGTEEDQKKRYQEYLDSIKKKK